MPRKSNHCRGAAVLCLSFILALSVDGIPWIAGQPHPSNDDPAKQAQTTEREVSFKRCGNCPVSRAFIAVFGTLSLLLSI
jgi:hypothetical protein